MRVVFLSSYDPLSAKSWSGTPLYMYNALKNNNVEIIVLGPVFSFAKIFLKGYKFIRKIFGKDDYDYTYSNLISFEYAFRFKYRLRKLKAVDAIIAPAGSTEIAHLNTKIPIIYLSDTTYDQLKDYYPNFKKINKKCLEKGSVIEKKALERATFISLPSRWAKDFCIKYYNIQENKVKHILWGANIHGAIPELSFYDKERYINLKNEFVILFLGVDWYRKGGYVALEAVRHLREERGIKAKLKVCGCRPDLKELPSWVEIIGKLNKNDPSDYSKFDNLLKTSDLLLLPTKAECYGMVFCEAAAYALPVVATNTGGINSIVANQETGILISDAEDYKSFSNALYEILNDSEKYFLYSQKARERYNTHLNWNVWAKNIKELIYELKK